MSEKMEEYKFKNHKEWFLALQNAPNPKFVKSRSISGGKNSHYVPLPIQEALADMFFREYDVIESQETIYDRQIVVKVKISLLPNYPGSEHRIISGIGAKVLAKSGNSLEFGAPSAQAAAKSNALSSFANIFGRNLNRADVSNDFSYYTTKKESK